MDTQFLETTIENGLARIVLNRPEKQNALNAEVIATLNDWLKQIAKNRSVQFVIIEGKGKSFCAGADLQWFVDAANLPEKEIREQFEPLGKMLRRLQNLPQVTIALAKGNIFGGGTGLLAACDFVLMEESSILAFSEVLLGLAPAIILPFVAGRISRQEARKLMLTGKYFSASYAQTIGLADDVVAEERLEETLQTLLTGFKKAAPEAVQTCKKLLNNVYCGKVGVENYRHMAKMLATRVASEEGKKRIGVFLEKRK